jgi:hypothetical protein
MHSYEFDFRVALWVVAVGAHFDVDFHDLPPQKVNQQFGNFHINHLPLRLRTVHQSR